MKTFETRNALQEALTLDRNTGKSIAFVPTMGNLHDGHIELVRQAKSQADVVVVSIFVNPMQFDQQGDLDNYPRTLEADSEKLEAVDTDYLFFPAVKEMYPSGMNSQTIVSVPGISKRHCGSSRPGHFDGVSTVVTKLFQLVLPNKAFFGEKDFQQLAVIKKMVLDLCIPIEVIGVPTVRAEDGLALSSRNNHLSSEQRKLAPLLYKTLQRCKTALLSSNDAINLENRAEAQLEQAGFVKDYFNICHATTLNPAQTEDKDIVIVAAAFLGETRLIDNIAFTRQ